MIEVVDHDLYASEAASTACWNSSAVVSGTRVTTACDDWEG